MNGPLRFRKRPVERTAIQWDGTFEGYLDVAAWCGTAVEWHPERTHDTSERADGTIATFERPQPVPQHVRLFVAANNEWLRLTPGEWIIQDELGFYPCKPDIFSETYDNDPGVTVGVRSATATVEVRVIAKGQPHPEGVNLGTVYLVAPPQDVADVRAVVARALRDGPTG